ncbi:hypothetical protein AMTRI_Chr13g86120 [Amborella trichopoda]
MFIIRFPLISCNTYSSSIKKDTCREYLLPFCYSCSLPFYKRNTEASRETKRKFESVHKGGTMSTPDSGRVLQYWHCCGSEDPFDPGCTAAPHQSYDD